MSNHSIKEYYHPAKRSDSKGFTLLEVLIAFTIAALALGVMMSVATEGQQSVRVGGRYEEALSRAKSHMAALADEATLPEGTMQGDDGHGYQWHLNIRQTGVAQSGTETDQPSSAPNISKPILYAVEVAVSWGGQEGRIRQVLLRSQRLGSLPAAKP